MSKMENDALRYRQLASDYAAESEAKIASIEMNKFNHDGKDKIYFTVWYKLDRRDYPFTYFCRDLATAEDLKKLDGQTFCDLLLQWGRMDEESEWGKPKVRAIYINDGEEVKLSGGVDEFPED